MYCTGPGDRHNDEKGKDEFQITRKSSFINIPCPARNILNLISNVRFKRMKWTDIATFLIAHAVAAGAYLLIFLSVPAVLGGIAVVLLLIGGIITGDMGGPLFLPGVFFMGLIYALCVTALGMILFLVTGSIQLIRRRVRVSAWVPVVLAFPVVFTVIVVSRSGGVFLSIPVSAAFLTYWLAFSGSDAILKWIKRKWTKRNQNKLMQGICA